MTGKTQDLLDVPKSAVSSSPRKRWVRPEIEDASVLMATTAPSTDPSNAELGTAKNGS